MSAARRVVLVGHRSAALRSARRLGVEVIRVDASPPRTRTGVVAHLAWPTAASDPAAWRALATELPERERIAAVIAVTEAAVVPAARLREALALDGMDVATALRCTDKLAMKTAIRDAGLRCADFLPCEPGLARSTLIEALGLPLVLKPRTGSGGRGHRMIGEARELPDPLPAGFLAERFVHGTELSSEALLLRGEVLFTNATEYLRVRESNVVPAPLTTEQAALLDAFHRAALRALGVHQGVTHTEIFLGSDGPVFGETAVRPPGGHIMRLIELAYGFDAWRVWLEIQLGVCPELETRARRVAGAWVLHEGAGRVHAITGLEAARALPGVKVAHLRVSVGDRVGPRLGSGDEIGHLIVVGRDRDDVAARLSAARAALRIEMER
jgi:biotin carboxylase